MDVELSGLFFSTDDYEWCCYRRNLFSVRCTLNFRTSSGEPFYLEAENNRYPNKIIGFHLCLSATNESGDPLKLRKVPWSAEENQIQSSRVPPFNDVGVDSYPALDAPKAGLSHSSMQFDEGVDPPCLTTFTRMQFEIATMNNGRRKNPQQYHHLVVNLSAELGSETKSLIPIATRISCPLVVRGRSPRNFAGKPAPLAPYPKPSENKITKSNEALPLFKEMGNQISKAESAFPVPSKSVDVSNARLPPFDPSSMNDDRDRLYCVWCGKGPMNLEWHGYCMSCHRLNDTFATHASSYVESQESIDTGNPLWAEPKPEESNLEHSEINASPVDASDNSSISSHGFSMKSLVSSKSSIAVQAEIDVRLVDLLLEDNGFKALCADGFQFLDLDRFERNLRRLLKIFLKKVRLDSSSEIHRIFMRYRHDRAKETASALRSRFATYSGDDKQNMQSLTNVEVAKEQLLQRYINDSSVYQDCTDPDTDFSRRPQEVQTSRKDPESSSSNSEQSSDDQAEPIKSALSKAMMKLIVFGSDAWEDLREGLMGFLVPILVAKFQAQYQTAVTSRLCEYGTDYSSLPDNGPLLAVIENGQAACQTLASERMLRFESGIVRTDFLYSNVRRKLPSWSQGKAQRLRSITS